MPTRRPDESGQLAWGMPTGRVRPGRVERRTADACRRLRREGRLTPADDGMVALAVELARAVDIAARTYAANPSAGHGMAAAQLGRVLADAHAQLAARAGDTGSAFDAFLAGLSTPEPHPPR